MLNVISDPKGIDVPIRKLQEKLHASLMSKWGLDVNNPDQNILYQSYGRCYRNKKDDGYIAEVYKGNNEYKEVYWDDSLYAISFFGISNELLHDKAEKSEVHLVFFVNLDKLKPDVSHRADEEVRLDVLSIIGYSLFGFNYKSVSLSIENVLKEYPGSRRDDRLKFVDMHPIHCFRINLSLIYNINNCFQKLKLK